MSRVEYQIGSRQRQRGRHRRLQCPGDLELLVHSNLSGHYWWRSGTSEFFGTSGQSPQSSASWLMTALETLVFRHFLGSLSTVSCGTGCRRALRTQGLGLGGGWIGHVAHHPRSCLYCRMEAPVLVGINYTTVLYDTTWYCRALSQKPINKY